MNLFHRLYHIHKRVFYPILPAIPGLCLLLLLGCQKAQPYVDNIPEEKTKQADPEIRFWSKSSSPTSIPIHFVSGETDSKRWETLPEYWNKVTDKDNTKAILIKVPLGLPDPLPRIPENNLPSLSKWRLGKLLFFDNTWLSGSANLSCAGCHRPSTGFSERKQWRNPPRMQGPSLLNCVYNEHQFWDGRVKSLEEVLPQTDRNNADTGQVHQFDWPKILPRLQEQKRFRTLLEAAYGSSQPSAQAVCQSLATYMRTLLSGDSLYDRARITAEKAKSEELLAEHFAAHLSPELLKSLNQAPDTDKETAARMLAAGYKFFHSPETRCSHCHSGWNFTDNKFHNIGIRESDYLQIPGKEFGRIRQVPFALKDVSLIGAFRTPSLRNLATTAPYFHDGSAVTLTSVIQHYNVGLPQRNRYLDKRLRLSPTQPVRMKMVNYRIEALEAFLLSLHGEPLPTIVSQP